MSSTQMMEGQAVIVTGSGSGSGSGRGNGPEMGMHKARQGTRVVANAFGWHPA